MVKEYPQNGEPEGTGTMPPSISPFRRMRGATLPLSIGAIERDIFHRVTIDLPSLEFPNIMEAIRDIVLTEELGNNSINLLNPIHLSLVDFERRIVGDMDRVFDTHRDDFAQAIGNGGTDLLDMFLNISIDRYGQPFSVREAVNILLKAVTSPDLYPSPHSRNLLQTDIAKIMEVVTKITAEKDPLSLTPEETLQLKENTNRPYAILMFDLGCANLCNLDGYEKAKQRYVDAKLAYQHKNDLIGVVDDFENGNANIVIAYAKKFGELSQLLTTLQKPMPLAGNSFYEICRLIKKVAPQTYASIYDSQAHLLDSAKLSEGLRDRFALHEVE